MRVILSHYSLSTNWPNIMILLLTPSCRWNVFKDVDQTFFLFANRARSWSLSSHAERTKTYEVFTGKKQILARNFFVGIAAQVKENSKVGFPFADRWRWNSRNVSVGMYILFNVLFRWLADVSVGSSERFQCDCPQNLCFILEYRTLLCVAKEEGTLLRF